MKNLSRGVMAAILVGTLALAGCAVPMSSADVYSPYDTQREQTVRMGTIESVRAVAISNNGGRSSGLGLLGGGAVGAVAGSAIGGGRGSLLTGIVGGIAGAVAGNAIENRAAVSQGIEITVRLDNGSLRAITQQATGEYFQAGDRVRLLSSGGETRVTH
jgi:outer membrane lipoprotein SlyB